MENFVLAGKAKTVFKLIELKAKMEAERLEREAPDKSRIFGICNHESRSEKR